MKQEEKLKVQVEVTPGYQLGCPIMLTCEANKVKTAQLSGIQSHIFWMPGTPCILCPGDRPVRGDDPVREEAEDGAGQALREWPSSAFIKVP